MVMRESIKAYGIDQAYEFLQKDFQNDSIPSKFVNLDDIPEISDDFYDSLEDNGGIIFGFTSHEMGENVNQIKTIVDNRPTKGDKKYKTVYTAVWDYTNGSRQVPGVQSEIKKECIDKTREAVEKSGRAAYVIIGKLPSNFERAQAKIYYKPSSKQEMGTYTFIW